MRSLLNCVIVPILLVAPLSGCGWFGGSEEESQMELPEWLSEEDDGSPSPEAFAEESATARLELALRPGVRFPMRKLVEQELTQASLSGQPELSQSQLELLMTITVNEVRGGRASMQVVYDHVRYLQQINGVSVAYDSSAPPAEIPAAALAYHGMLGDGFRFTLGPNNQIESVEGFRDFLQRSLRFLPEEERTQVLLDKDAGSHEQAIAEFIDHTIGLLPYGVDRKVGDQWDRSRRVFGPVPMTITTVCTLQDVAADTVDVALEGSIAPCAPPERNGADPESLQVQVTGGRCYGTCTVSRETGLPQESQVVEEVDMLVRVGAGLEFDQHKRMVTTVETYPAESVQMTGDPIGPRGY